MLDNSDFIDTDIPLEVALPEAPGISVSTLIVAHRLITHYYIV